MIHGDQLSLVLDYLVFQPYYEQEIGKDGLHKGNLGG